TKVAAKVMTSPQVAMENSLEQNYPNPFSQTTTIKYSLAKPGTVNLALYDVHGRLVKSMVNGWKEAGTYTVQLEKASLQGGLYFYKMQTSGFSAARKLIVQ
ncbi:MAG TPA: T9SS type A sorting domain-containing protein, partial [Chitinophagaceae bacterium]|nr:T9SS type A sorting domain-containing protein [Chitinophagaceae bacterium]